MHTQQAFYSSLFKKSNTPLFFGQHNSNVKAEAAPAATPATPVIPKFFKTRQTAREVAKIDPKQLKDFKEVKFIKKDISQVYSKVFDVTNMIIGLNAREALRQLDRCDKAAAKTLHKFLRGCMLNCENTHGMNADRLLIRTL